MSLLNDMYRGKLHPLDEANLWWNEEYVMLVRECSEIEDKINEASPEVRDLFEKYQDLQNQINALSLYHEFSIGVRLGAQLIEELKIPLVFPKK